MALSTTVIWYHSTKKPVTTMLTYPWKCTSASEGDNQSVRSSAPVVSRCFPGGYNIKLYISRGRLAWWLLAFLHSGIQRTYWLWMREKFEHVWLWIICTHWLKKKVCFSLDVLRLFEICCPQCSNYTLTLTVLVTTIDAQWEGMGDVGSARYEPALLPPCPTIRVLSYSN